MFARVIYCCAGSTASSTRLLLSITNRTCWEICPGPMMQLRQGFRQILRMYLFVWRIFQLHLPSMRRRRRGGDEEQLPCIRQVEMLVFGLDAGRLAEIHLDTLPHDCLAIEDLPNSNRGVFVEEGDYDAPEGFERCPRVDRC